MSVTALQEPAVKKPDPKGEAILEAAKEAFLTSGFDAASMDAIAATAEVSKRTIYNRYPSKEALFSAIIERLCRKILPVNLPETELDEPPEVFLQHFGEDFLHGILEEDALRLHRIVTFSAISSPALQKAYFQAGPEEMIKTACFYFEHQRKLGRLKIDDCRRATWQLGTLLKEPLFTYAIMGRRPDDLDTAVKEQVKSAVYVFMKAYGT